jgi:hypothetical protein
VKQVSCAGTGALSCAGRTQTARGAPPAAPSTPPPRSTSPAASTPRLRHAKARRVRQRLPRVGIKNAGLVRFPTRQRPIGQRRRGWRRTQAARVHVHAHVGDVTSNQGGAGGAPRRRESTSTHTLEMYAAGSASSGAGTRTSAVPTTQSSSPRSSCSATRHAKRCLLRSWMRPRTQRDSCRCGGHEAAG